MIGRGITEVAIAPGKFGATIVDAASKHHRRRGTRVIVTFPSFSLAKAGHDHADRGKSVPQIVKIGTAVRRVAVIAVLTFRPVISILNLESSTNFITHM